MKYFLNIYFLSILIILLQIFIPMINFYSIELVPDLLIVFLVYVGFFYGRIKAIILGFIFGLIQDFVCQFDLLGTMTFAKSISGYALGTLLLYKSIWSKFFRLLFIMLIIFIHFFIFYYIRFNGVLISSYLLFQVVIFNLCLSFLILLIVDRAIISKGVTN